MLPSPAPRPARPAPPRQPARAGFTLIELLIAVVIVGLLAALAVPRFANTKGKANLATVKSDLHNLVSMQENYFYEYQVYASDLSALATQPSEGVVLTIVEATATGFAAKAEHPAAVPITCAVFYGQAAPLPPATTEGVVACQ